MRYVGLDAHWRQSTICVLDSHGKKLSTQTVRADWSKVLEELAKIRKPFSVCFEASSGYGFLFEKLQVMARRVVVAHPGQHSRGRSANRGGGRCLYRRTSTVPA